MFFLVLFGKYLSATPLLVQLLLASSLAESSSAAFNFWGGRRGWGVVYPGDFCLANCDLHITIQAQSISKKMRAVIASAASKDDQCLPIGSQLPQQAFAVTVRSTKYPAKAS